MTTTLGTLITVQILLGAFDTLYHHELTERLAWRRSQAGELRLHGVRNLAYAVLFAGLGFCQPQGAFALAVIALLCAELVITLIDFVEEDRTRALPATERVTHTLLALNYGAILAFLLPTLAGWAGQGTALVPATYGAWTALMLGSALGVALFGLRDLAASARLRRIRPAPADALLPPSPPQDILVTGGTGFVGERLVAALTAAGHRVTVLTRTPKKAAALPAPVRIVTDLAQIGNAERIDIVVSLAGEPVASGLWTKRRRTRIVTSRVRTARAVRRFCERLDTPPRVVIAASAIGAYGLRGDLPVTEAEPIRRDGSFSQRSCEATERAYGRIGARTRTRIVHLRTGLVLGTEGGVLGRMLLPFEFGLGGAFGTGRQWMSWIGRDDLVRLIWHAATQGEIEGPLNAVAPAPVRNEAFAHTLAGALHRPCLLRVPAWALRPTGGLGRELFLGGQCVLPAKALATGFAFRDPALAPLLRRLVGTAAPEGAEAGTFSVRGEPPKAAVVRLAA